jgi:hypothetical protein
LDLEPEVALAGQWFDHLRQHSRSRLGVTRASYGEGEQMAHDLMRRIATWRSSSGSTRRAISTSHCRDATGRCRRS